MESTARRLRRWKSVGVSLWFGSVVLALSTVALAELAAPSLDGIQSAPGTPSPLRSTAQQGVTNERSAAALVATSALPDSKARFLTLIKRGEAFQARGSFADASMDFAAALSLAERDNDTVRIALAAGSLSAVMLARGETAAATIQSETSIARAREAGRKDIEAVSRNGLGNVKASEGQHAAALASYRVSAALALETGQPTLEASATINAARAAAALGDAATARALLAQAAKRLDAVPARDHARMLLSMGRIAQRIGPAPALQIGEDQLAVTSLFEQASRAAEAQHDLRSLSFAQGYLGEGEYGAGRLDEEKRHLQRAIFAAREAQAPEIEYRWQWQMGRLLRDSGDAEGAIQALRLAVKALQSVRAELQRASAGAPSSFQAQVKSAFYDFVAALLERARATDAPTEAAQLLLEARDTVESLKAAELQDYFRNECVPPTYTRKDPLEKLAPRTAVVYPILFSDRIELLVSSADRIRHVTSRVGLEALAKEVDQFRNALLDFAGPGYLPHAKRLYDWLVRPIQSELDATPIDTLVFVPDGPLRTIPLSALHDGRDFLIRKYAFVTSPGLTLTDVRALQRVNPRALLGGLSESVQGYPALPAVPQELDAVQRLFGGTRLQDRDFVIPNLQQAIADRRAGIVHIATHARFESDVEQSYLLTYDGKLRLGQLEDIVGMTQTHPQPVELLTLSACQTARGDERAALGLAGVAVKAGARSALAALWEIDDEATAVLVPEFYRQLSNPTVSDKAAALRNAQLELLGDERFDHPGFWSPFLLIGNWL